MPARAPNRPSNPLALQHDAETAAGSYPALLLEAERVAQTINAGLHGRRRSGMGETFWQYRPFTSGDAAGLIDWRQSARAADKLYVRESEWETAATVWVWCDNQSSLNYAANGALPTKLWRAQVLAAALCALLARAGERVGLVGAADRPFLGKNALPRFAEHLLGADPASGLPVLPSAARHKSVVFFSDFFMPIEDIENNIRAAAAEGINGHLVQILDPSELSFPFKGRTEFLTIDRKMKLLFGDAGAISNQYKDNFTAHRQSMVDICQQYGWTCHRHITESPASAGLMPIYSALSSKGGVTP